MDDKMDEPRKLIDEHPILLNIQNGEIDLNETDKIIKKLYKYIKMPKELIYLIYDYISIWNVKRQYSNYILENKKYAINVNKKYATNVNINIDISPIHHIKIKECKPLITKCSNGKYKNGEILVTERGCNRIINELKYCKNINNNQYFLLTEIDTDIYLTEVFNNNLTKSKMQFDDSCTVDIKNILGEELRKYIVITALTYIVHKKIEYNYGIVNINRRDIDDIIIMFEIIKYILNKNEIQS